VYILFTDGEVFTTGTNTKLPAPSTLNALPSKEGVVELVLVKFVNLTPDVPAVALVICNLVLGVVVPIPTLVPVAVGKVF
jgi:hypothetical protein